MLPTVNIIANANDKDLPTVNVSSTPHFQFLTCLQASGGAATISYQDADYVAGGGSVTISLVVESAVGKERLIALASIRNINPYVPYANVAVDGQAATQIGPTVFISDGTDPHIGPSVTFWRAPGTANTNIDVTCTVGGVFETRVALWTLGGAGALLDYASAAQAILDGNPATGTLDVDTASSGVVAGVVLWYNTDVLDTWTGLTKRFDGLNVYGHDHIGVADLAVVSAAVPQTVLVSIPAVITGNSAFAALVISLSPGSAPHTATGLPTYQDSGGAVRGVKTIYIPGYVAPGS